MKQWDLPANSTVILPNGDTATFLKMDGMYAQWEQNGEKKIGNFDKLEAVNADKKLYKVV